jgi:hypothetical protein
LSQRCQVGFRLRQVKERNCVVTDRVERKAVALRALRADGSGRSVCDLIGLESPQVEGHASRIVADVIAPVRSDLRRVGHSGFKGCRQPVERRIDFVGRGGRSNTVWDCDRRWLIFCVVATSCKDSTARAPQPVMSRASCSKTGVVPLR